MGCSSSQTAHRAQSFRNRLLQHGPTAESQILPANLLQWGLHRAFFKHPSLPLWAPPRAAGAQLPHQGLHHRLPETLSSSIWSTFSTSFFPDLGVCRSVSLTPLSSCNCAGFFPFLTLILEVLPPSLMALVWIHLGVRQRRSFWQLLTEATLQPNPIHSLGTHDNLNPAAIRPVHTLLTYLRLSFCFFRFQNC